MFHMEKRSRNTLIIIIITGMFRDKEADKRCLTLSVKICGTKTQKGLSLHGKAAQ